MDFIIVGGFQYRAVFFVCAECVDDIMEVGLEKESRDNAGIGVGSAHCHF